MGFVIFKLCLIQVLKNWKMALRLSWPFFLLTTVLLVVSQFITEAKILNVTEGTANNNVILAMLIAVSLVIFIFGGMIMIAIGWHRYVLLGDPGTVAYVLQPIGRVRMYFWQGLKVFLVVLFAAFVAEIASTFLLFLFSGALNAVGGPSLTTGVLLSLVNVIVVWFYIWVTLRLGLSLPAAALSTRMTLTESQNETGSLNGPIAVAALLVALLQIVPAFVFEELALMAESTTLFFVSAAFQIVIGFINFFISFGILTVLYGHIIDGRPIEEGGFEDEHSPKLNTAISLNTFGSRSIMELSVLRIEPK